MAKPKHGNLKDIRIEEVSMVDLPANKQPFMFFKQDGTGQTQLTKAKKKITIEIASDGTVGGTQIAVNGEDLGKLKSFDFGFYSDDPKSPVNASYSKISGSKDGFSRTEAYYLTKGVFAMTKEMLKALQEYFGTDEIDFEKKVDGEIVQKALILITKHYQESFPEDLENAVGILAKCASGGYAAKEKVDVEKVGAKFSKDVLNKVAAVVAAVKALEGILPQASATQKVDDDPMAELTKQVSELNEAVTELGKPKEKAKNEKPEELAELTETLKKVSERVKAMEKDTAGRKSLVDQDEDDDEHKTKGIGKDGKVKWPSIVNPEE